MDKVEIDRIIEQHKGKTHSLIHVLMAIQSANHWLPKEVLDEVSEKLEVPLSRVMQIVTFYKTFSLMPKGRHQVQVCTGTSCHVRGAAHILEKVQECIGIQPGQTDTEVKFSLETGNCLGCCASGPEIVVDGKHHGRITAAGVDDVLKSYA